MSQKNTYWNDHGKYQKQADELGTLVPDFGYTDNADLNLFITISKLYHDAYNNGGGNIYDCYARDFERYVLPALPGIRLDAFTECNEDEIEDYVDRTLEYLAGKNLSCTVYTVFYNYDEMLMSLEKQNGPGWMPVTFGYEDDRKQWIRWQTLLDIRMI